MGINLKLMIDSDLTYCVSFYLDMNNNTIIVYIPRVVRGIQLENDDIYTTQDVYLHWTTS